VSRFVLSGALVSALLALLAPAPARAAGPIAWCGIDTAAADRQPDETTGYSFHLIYAYPADGGDGFASWAPRIAGDIASVEEWWRSQDPTRAPRFDLHAFPCASPWGRLDISRVQLSQSAAFYAPVFGGGPDNTFTRITRELGTTFARKDKKYLVHYDGPLEYGSSWPACGQGRTGYPEGGAESFAIFYLRACGFETVDLFREKATAHELIHVLNAVAPGAPNACADSPGHVCDNLADVMARENVFGLTALSQRILDAGRDDYYGHGGSHFDVQDSLFLERLDGSDRAAPSAPAELSASNDATGAVTLTWRPSSDDVGPVNYVVFRDGVGLARTVSSEGGTVSLTDYRPEGVTVEYAVKASDAVGHLSRPTSLRFTVGLGIVDGNGGLLRDTVAPPAIDDVRVTKGKTGVTLRWDAVRDPGGLRGYRIAVGGKTLGVVSGRSATIPRTRLGRSPVSIAPVDRAGNAGPPVTVSIRSMR